MGPFLVGVGCLAVPAVPLRLPFIILLPIESLLEMSYT